MKTSSTSVRRHRAGFAKSSLALAVTALLSSTAFAATAPSTSLATVAHPTLLSRGDAVIGALPVNHPMHVVVALKLRNKDVLDQFVAGAMKDKAAGKTAATMTREEVLANHAPTQEQARAVANYLAGMGFSNVRIADNRMLVTADGTAATAGRAFLTSFRQVRTHDGRIAFANADDIRVPASFHDTVLSVLGMQDVHQLHTLHTGPKALPAHARTDGSVHTLFTNYYFPEEFATIYGASSAPVASGVTVGIISEGNVASTITDLNSYTDGIGFPRVTTSIVNSSTTTTTDTAGQVEWNLDSQSIVGTAGGQLHQLNFYIMPDMTNGSLVANFNKVVSDNQVKIANASIGECELGAQGGGGADAADAIFEIGVAQGQTFSISTGDSGADECKNGALTPSWPANSQYVVAVAGTNLVAGTPGRANAKAWSSETEWTDSGGSQSTYEPKPSWQTLWSGAHRGVADVAFDADSNTGAAIYIGAPAETTPGYYLVGGTSLAAPIFSGLWSRVLQHKPTIGFAGPVIYGLQAADFHDITSGSNGIAAGVGYDLASGRGSMILSSVITDIDANSLGNHAPTVNYTQVVQARHVKFTDSSTDAEGSTTIASHSWNFGDGKTSTAASPTHVFAVPGTYSVTETVTDKVGASASKTTSLTVTASSQLLLNPGFESGDSGAWSLTAGTLRNDATKAFKGSWYVELGGGSGAHTDTATQNIAIASGLTSAKLTYYVKTTTTETTATARDKLTVEVVQGGVVVATLDTVSNLDASTGYKQRNADLSAYIGKSISLKFHGTNGAANPTTWDIDSVQVNVQ